MDFPFYFCMISIIFLGAIWGVAADGNLTDNSTINYTFSANIFSFSTASPYDDPPGMDGFNNTSPIKNPESIEEHYNSIISETDTSLPHLNLLGIPMECHFCLAFRSTQIR